MDIAPFELNKLKAHDLWKEYVEACKKNPKDNFLVDMKNIYNQLKSGRKIIDINEVMKRGGLTIDGFPKLSVAKADRKIGYCIYNKNGKVVFSCREPVWYNSVMKSDIVISNVYPPLPDDKITKKYNNCIALQAPVPAIPASIRPSNNLSSYHILWEVEKWEPVPPRDPYLLRRLTPNMFVVVAGWNLTELERAVMRGRV